MLVSETPARKRPDTGDSRGTTPQALWRLVSRWTLGSSRSTRLCTPPSVLLPRRVPVRTLAPRANLRLLGHVSRNPLVPAALASISQDSHPWHPISMAPLRDDVKALTRRRIPIGKGSLHGQRATTRMCWTASRRIATATRFPMIARAVELVGQLDLLCRDRGDHFKLIARLSTQAPEGSAWRLTLDGRRMREVVIDTHGEARGGSTGPGASFVAARAGHVLCMTGLIPRARVAGAGPARQGRASREKIAKSRKHRPRAQGRASGFGFAKNGAPRNSAQALFPEESARFAPRSARKRIFFFAKRSHSRQPETPASPVAAAPRYRRGRPRAGPRMPPERTRSSASRTRGNDGCSILARAKMTDARFQHARK